MCGGEGPGPERPEQLCQADRSARRALCCSVCTAAPLFCPLRPSRGGNSSPLCLTDLQPETKASGACLRPCGALMQHVYVHAGMCCLCECVHYALIRFTHTRTVTFKSQWCLSNTRECFEYVHYNSNQSKLVHRRNRYDPNAGKGTNPGLYCRTYVYKGPALLFSGKLHTLRLIFTATRGRLTSYLTSTEEWKNWAWRSL